MTAIALYAQMAAALATGPLTLATVVEIRGSVPREVGAKMLILPNGHTVETIGGGAGEAKVIQQALTVLTTGEKQFIEIDLTGTMQTAIDGICGGQMRVWLERWQGEAAIALVQQLLHTLQSGQSVTLVTPFAQTRSPYLTHEVAPEPAIGCTATDLREHLAPPPALLIVGAGHCGIQLAKVADLIGFQVFVQDDRPEWANTTHYPQVSRIFTDPIAPVVAQFQHHPHLYAALVTRGYQYDLEALQALLTRPHPCTYLGMIGSEKRVRQVFNAIAQKGISPARLQSIHAPIGLDIGALTPEEIAVSISAELILVRRGGTGQPLSQTLRQRQRQ